MMTLLTAVVLLQVSDAPLREGLEPVAAEPAPVTTEPPAPAAMLASTRAWADAGAMLGIGALSITTVSLLQASMCRSNPNLPCGLASLGVSSLATLALAPVVGWGVDRILGGDGRFIDAFRGHSIGYVAWPVLLWLLSTGYSIIGEAGKATLISTLTHLATEGYQASWLWFAVPAVLVGTLGGVVGLHRGLDFDAPRTAAQP